MENVDVIIPTYKGPRFLIRAIESVLVQTYENVSVIVVDDNNAGDEYRVENEKLMSRYSQNKKVHYLKHEFNMNGAAARNTAIKYSTAKYIAFLDDDDFYTPTRIENQLKILANLPNIYGGIFCFHVRRYKGYAYSKYSCEEKESSNYSFDFLSGKTSFPSSTLLFRSSIFKKVGLFDENFDRHQDWEFLVRFFRYFKMSISPRYDTYMQIDGFRNYPKATKAFEIKEQFLNKYQDDISKYTQEEQNAIYKFQWFDIACLFLKERKFKKSYRVFRYEIYRNENITIRDVIRIIFFITFGFIPGLKKLTAHLLGSTVFKKYSYHFPKY